MRRTIRVITNTIAERVIGIPAFRALAILVFLVPYVVGFTPSPEDSTSTLISVAAGTGSYAHVSRDCSGKVTNVENIPYTDYGVGVERRVGGMSFGARGGTAHVDEEQGRGYTQYAEQRTWYVNPYAGIDGRVVGAQLGVVFLDNTAVGPDSNVRLKYAETVLPSVALRFGSTDGLYSTLSFASNLPLGTGGGLLDIGLGGPIGEAGGSIWGGFAFLPYEEGAYSFKGTVPVLGNLTLDPRLQVRFGDASEYGFSIGGRIRF